MTTFQCLFRAEIGSPRRSGETKFITVDRKDGTRFMQIRIFTSSPSGFKATSTGVSFSTSAARTLIDLDNTILTLNKDSYGKDFLSPRGMHQLTEDAWLTIGKQGQEVLLLRRNGESVKGISLNVREYELLRNHLEAVNYLLFPITHPKNVEIINSTTYEIASILGDLRMEHCEGCSLELGNQEGHSCLFLSSEDAVHLYFKEAVDRAQLPRVLNRVQYLHDALNCVNPLPSIEQVQEHLRDPECYLQEMHKKNSYHLLLQSLDELVSSS